MSNKIDQLFKRTLGKEKFEYKASYFEALERQGLPMKRSFFWRNKQFLLFAIPLLFIGSATMAYYFAQNGSSKEDTIALNETNAATQLNTSAEKLEDASGQQLAYHTPSPTPAPASSAALNTNYSSSNPDPRVSQDEIPARSTKNAKPINSTSNTTGKEIKPFQQTNQNSNSNVSNSPKEALSSEDKDIFDQRTSNDKNALTDASSFSKQVEQASDLQAQSDSRKANSTTTGNTGTKVPTLPSTQLANSEAATTAPSLGKSSSIGNRNSGSGSGSIVANSVITSGNYSLNSQQDRNISANAANSNTDNFSEGLALDSMNICLVDGNSTSPLQSAESNALMVHPKGRKNSSWFIGVNTQYNFFSKDPFAEGPYKKYMRMRIAGESLNNNFSYGLHAKRVGRMLTYSAGLNIGVLSEDIGYIGQKNLYDVKTTYVNLGDTLNASPGSPRPTLLNMRIVKDSTLIGKVDTAFQKRTNTLNYFAIPLSIGYHHQIGRVSADVQGGVNLMYAYKMNGYYLHESREYMNPVGEYLSRFSVTPMVGFELNYQLNSHWMLGSQFTYKMPNAQFSTDANFIWKQSSLGVNLAYRIR